MRFNLAKTGGFWLIAALALAAAVAFVALSGDKRALAQSPPPVSTNHVFIDSLSFRSTNVDLELAPVYDLDWISLFQKVRNPDTFQETRRIALKHTLQGAVNYPPLRDVSASAPASFRNISLRDRENLVNLSALYKYKRGDWDRDGRAGTLIIPASMIVNGLPFNLDALPLSESPSISTLYDSDQSSHEMNSYGVSACAARFLNVTGVETKRTEAVFTFQLLDPKGSRRKCDFSAIENGRPKIVLKNFETVRSDDPSERVRNDVEIPIEEVDPLDPAAKRAYSAQWDLFLKWAEDEGESSLPATSETVVDYIVEKASDGVNLATLYHAAGGISDAHRTAGLSDPVGSQAVRSALADVERDTGESPPKAKKGIHLVLQIDNTTNSVSQIHSQKIVAVVPSFPGAGDPPPRVRRKWPPGASSDSEWWQPVDKAAGEDADASAYVYKVRVPINNPGVTQNFTVNASMSIRVGLPAQKVKYIRNVGVLAENPEFAAANSAGGECAPDEDDANGDDSNGDDADADDGCAVPKYVTREYKSITERTVPLEDTYIFQNFEPVSFSVTTPSNARRAAPVYAGPAPTPTISAYWRKRLGLDLTPRPNYTATPTSQPMSRANLATATPGPGAGTLTTLEAIATFTPSPTPTATATPSPTSTPTSTPTTGQPAQQPAQAPAEEQEAGSDESGCTVGVSPLTFRTAVLGAWTSSDCVSRVVPTRKADFYRFDVASESVVEIDLDASATAGLKPYFYAIKLAAGKTVTANDVKRAQLFTSATSATSGGAVEVIKRLEPGRYILVATTLPSLDSGVEDPNSSGLGSYTLEVSEQVQAQTVSFRECPDASVVNLPVNVRIYQKPGSYLRTIDTVEYANDYLSGGSAAGGCISRYSGASNPTPSNVYRFRLVSSGLYRIEILPSDLHRVASNVSPHRESEFRVPYPVVLLTEGYDPAKGAKIQGAPLIDVTDNSRGSVKQVRRLTDGFYTLDVSTANAESLSAKNRYKIRVTNICASYYDIGDAKTVTMDEFDENDFDIKRCRSFNLVRDISAPVNVAPSRGGSARSNQFANFCEKVQVSVRGTLGGRHGNRHTLSNKWDRSWVVGVEAENWELNPSRVRAQSYETRLGRDRRSPHARTFTVTDQIRNQQGLGMVKNEPHKRFYNIKTSELLSKYRTPLTRLTLRFTDERLQPLQTNSGGQRYSYPSVEHFGNYSASGGHRTQVTRTLGLYPAKIRVDGCYSDSRYPYTLRYSGYDYEWTSRRSGLLGIISQEDGKFYTPGRASSYTNSSRSGSSSYATCSITNILRVPRDFYGKQHAGPGLVKEALWTNASTTCSPMPRTLFRDEGASYSVSAWTRGGWTSIGAIDGIALGYTSGNASTWTGVPTATPRPAVAPTATATPTPWGWLGSNPNRHKSVSAATPTPTAAPPSAKRQSPRVSAPEVKWSEYRALEYAAWGAVPAANKTNVDCGGAPTDAEGDPATDKLEIRVLNQWEKWFWGFDAASQRTIIECKPTVYSIALIEAYDSGNGNITNHGSGPEKALNEKSDVASASDEISLRVNVSGTTTPQKGGGDIICEARFIQSAAYPSSSQTVRVSKASFGDSDTTATCVFPFADDRLYETDEEIRIRIYNDRLEKTYFDKDSPGIDGAIFHKTKSAVTVSVNKSDPVNLRLAMSYSRCGHSYYCNETAPSRVQMSATEEKKISAFVYRDSGWAYETQSGWRRNYWRWKRSNRPIAERTALSGYSDDHVIVPTRGEVIDDRPKVVDVLRNAPLAQCEIVMAESDPRKRGIIPYFPVSDEMRDKLEKEVFGPGGTKTTAIRDLDYSSARYGVINRVNADGDSVKVAAFIEGKCEFNVIVDAGETQTEPYFVKIKATAPDSGGPYALYDGTEDGVLLSPIIEIVPVARSP